MYPPKYIIRSLCNKYNILLIDDEHAGIVPDSITAGYMPLSVTVATDEIYNAFYADDTGGYRIFCHGHSYTAYPLAPAAFENLKINIEEYIRQTGMICAIELVKDKNTKEPFAYEYGIGKKIYKEGLKPGRCFASDVELHLLYNSLYYHPKRD